MPGTDDCSALSPCGTCGGDHCTIAGCPFRGFECNALNDNQPNEQPGTCRFNVIDPGYDGYDYYNSGSCQDMCSTFGWDCVRLEEYSDNVCGAQFVASYDCDQPVSTYPGHHGHAMCTCSPRTTSRRRLEPVYGPIELSSSCSDFNCFDGAHIMGYDITCEVGVSEAECADMCCSQANCKGFDFSASDHGWGAGRCCTGHVSRVEGGFEHNGGTYRSCEKNDVTSQDTDRGSESTSSGTFSYHSSPKSWEAARRDCQSRGGDLASIHSAAENQKAFELSRGGNMWLGLNDRAVEGRWTWSDGTPLGYQRWSESGADSWGGDEDCAGFWEGRGDGSWDDMYGEASCSQPLPYLCGIGGSRKDGQGQCKNVAKSRARGAGAIAVIVVCIVVGLLALLGASCALMRLISGRCYSRNAGGATVRAQAMPTATAYPMPGGVQMQGAVAQPVMATLVHESVAAVYPSASVEVQGEPMGTPVASMPLAEMAEILKREIGVGGTIQSVVQGAAQQLGIAHQGQPLMQTAQLCLQALGHRS